MQELEQLRAAAQALKEDVDLLRANQESQKTQEEGAGARAAEQDCAGPAGRELCHLRSAACCASLPSPICTPDAASQSLWPLDMNSALS